MNIIKFEDVRESIIGNFQRDMLIPVIGSGFTRGCDSYRGKVPSGADYFDYMVNEIAEALKLPEDEHQKLQNKSFSEVSEIYYSVEDISLEKKRDYLRHNFTCVQIEEEKRRLLSLPWPYVYTLNIDDGIERGSRYNHVILSNRTVNKKIFDEKECVIKLHGDVNDMITYTDSNCAVFTQKQYISSLRSNASLLSKLSHDSIYENLLYIGCSLDDEIDLLAYTGGQTNDSVVAKYYCTTKEPTKLEQIKLSKFGITHCVIFSSYNDIYTKIADAGDEARQVRTGDLEQYKRFAISRLSANYDENRSYFLFGKSLRQHRTT